MIDREQIVERMGRFSSASMLWCAHEADRIVNSVVEILDILVEDADRISSLSKDTLLAIQESRGRVVELQRSESGEALLANHTQMLIKELDSLVQTHHEIGELVGPILNVLQFQDRFSQNMQNLERMLKVWQETRKKVESSNSFGLEEREAYGKALYEFTTMESERRLLRSYFNDLPEEQNEILQEEDEFFF